MVGKRPDWLIVTLFGLVISLTTYLILDLDRSREGIITLAPINQSVVELREMFKKP